MLNTQPPEDEEPTDFAVPFDDDSEGPETQMNQGLKHDDSMSQVSDNGGGAQMNTSAISGLGDESNLHEANSATKRPSPQPKPRRRKKRKVVIDNENTELSNEHIKDMLANTEDIVRRQIHPAEEDDEDDTTDEMNNRSLDLTQPFLSKRLHPHLQEMWKDYYYQALDRPCPFEKLEKQEDTEVARQQEDDDDSRSAVSDAVGIPPADDDNEMVQQQEPDDDAFPINMDDDDDMVEQPPEQAEESEDEEEDQQPEGT